MAIAEIKLADGRVVEVRVPDGATQEQIGAFVQSNLASFAQPQKVPEQPAIDPIKAKTDELIAAGVNPNFARKEAERLVREDPQGRLKGQMETAGAVLSGIASEPIAGLAGLASTPFVGGEKGGEIVRKTRQALTPELSAEGAAEAGKLADVISPVTEKLEQAEEFIGGKTFEATGSPTAAAAAVTVPTALAELLGVAFARGGVRSAEKVRDIANAKPDERVSSILSASEKADVPVLTSDIFPPESFVGRSMKSFGEKLGPLGTGSARTSQQNARIEALEAFAEGIDIDSPFADSMVKSLNAKSARKMQDASNVRLEAVTKLDEFGGFKSPKAVSKIDELLAGQDKLGATANKQLTNELNNFKQELGETVFSDFSHKKDIRSQLIKRIKAFERAEDVAPAATLQQVKKELDKDLIDFARKNDREAARKWLSSNRDFAKEFEVTKNTEIKRILQSGDATPEKIIPILKGGKPSELNRLFNALGDKGRASARSALIQQALRDSKFFDVDQTPNPDAFANALNRPAFQQAAKVFFKGDEKKQLDGFNRLLNSTRAAQQSQAAPRTGEQLLLPGAGVVTGTAIGTGTLSAPAAIGGAAFLSGLIKSYESKPFRNLLIRLANTKQGSKLERQTLDLLTTAAVSAQQAARKEEEER